MSLPEDADDRDNAGTRRLQEAWRDGETSGDAGAVDFKRLREDARRELANG